MKLNMEEGGVGGRTKCQLSGRGCIFLAARHRQLSRVLKLPSGPEIRLESQLSVVTSNEDKKGE